MFLSVASLKTISNVSQWASMDDGDLWVQTSTTELQQEEMGEEHNKEDGFSLTESKNSLADDWGTAMGEGNK